MKGLHHVVGPDDLSMICTRSARKDVFGRLLTPYESIPGGICSVNILPKSSVWCGTASRPYRTLSSIFGRQTWVPKKGLHVMY